jgi:HTH-type transcriptional regulator/antitoxin HigA
LYEGPPQSRPAWPVPISPPTALQLEAVLGLPASFWRNVEKNHQETKTRLARRTEVQGRVDLLNDFPYSELVKLGFVRRALDPAERVEQCTLT